MSIKSWIVELFEVRSEALNWANNNPADCEPPSFGSIFAIDALLRDADSIYKENCMISPDGMGGISVYWKIWDTCLTLRSQGDPTTLSLYTKDKVWRDPTLEVFEEVWAQTFGIHP